jgi:hypothetical protein
VSSLGERDDIIGRTPKSFGEFVGLGAFLRSPLVSRADLTTRNTRHNFRRELEAE